MVLGIMLYNNSKIAPLNLTSSRSGLLCGRLRFPGPFPGTQTAENGVSWKLDACCSAVFRNQLLLL